MVMFRQYRSIFNEDRIILASQVTEGNLQALAVVTKAQGSYITDGVLRFDLHLYNNRLDDQEAEVGDYIIADGANKYLAVDKELFEDHYTTV